MAGKAYPDDFIQLCSDGLTDMVGDLLIEESSHPISPAKDRRELLVLDPCYPGGTST